MNGRVKGLDAPIHHLGETCQVAHRARIDGGVLDRLARAAGREELVAESLQPASEGGEAGLVANRHEGCFFWPAPCPRPASHASLTPITVGRTRGPAPYTLRRRGATRSPS